VSGWLRYGTRKETPGVWDDGTGSFSPTVNYVGMSTRVESQPESSLEFNAQLKRNHARGTISA
jgi:hypothetical protein